MKGSDAKWLEEYKKKQARIRELALLCLEKRDLTDDELKEVKEDGHEIYGYLSERGGFALHGAASLLRYRARRAELDKLPTEELQRRMSEINGARNAFFASHDDDDIDDSSFEGPGIDSDEYIVVEILDERRKKTA